MARFFDNVTGKQKIILILGGFVLLVVSMVVFPDETQRVVEFGMDGLRATFEFFRNLGAA